MTTQPRAVNRNTEWQADVVDESQHEVEGKVWQGASCGGEPPNQRMAVLIG